jgi:hypothetical protein
MHIRSLLPSIATLIAAACGSSEPTDGLSSVKFSVVGADFSGNSVRICGSRPPADLKYGCASDLLDENVECPCFDFNADGTLVGAGGVGAPAVSGLCPSINVPQADWTFSYAIYSAPGCMGTQINDGGHNFTCFDSHDVGLQAHPNQSVEPLAPGANVNHVLCLTTDATKDWSFDTCSVISTPAEVAAGQTRLDCGCAPVAGACDCGPGGITSGDLDSFCSFDTTSCEILCAPPTALILSYVDDVLPQTGVFGPGTATNDTSPLLQGVVAPIPLASGDVVSIYLDNALVGNATVTGGSWTFASPMLNPGFHTFVARLQDSGGATIATSADFPLQVITAAPSQPVIISVVVFGSNGTGMTQNGFATDDPRPSVFFLCTSNDIVAADIYDNGVLLSAATREGGNEWMFQPATALPFDTYVFAARCIDAAGNQSPLSDPFTLTITPQAISITSFVDDVPPMTGTFGPGSVTNDTTPELHGLVSPFPFPAFYSVALEVDGVLLAATPNPGGMWAFLDGTWTLGLPPLSEGTHSVVARLGQGPTGPFLFSSQPFVFTVDTTPPLAPSSFSVSAIEGTLEENDTTVDPMPTFFSECGTDAIAGNLYNGAALLAQAPLEGGGPGGMWSFQPASPLPNGTYDVALTCVDAAGNESTPFPSPAFTFTINAP